MQSAGRLSYLAAGTLMGLPLVGALACAGLLALAACLSVFLAGARLAPRPAVVSSVPARAPTPAVVVEARATLAALATRVADFSAHAAPSAAAPSPAPPALPAPVPHPLAEYTMDGLRARDYPGGTIRVREVLTTTLAFTRYYIDYPSDGLTITGIMQVPPGDGPFPVVILNHGYIHQDQYWSGADTWAAADYLNRRGYLTLAPDFRSWGGSDVGTSLFSTGQVIDVLNLVSSLPSLPQADSDRVGMWGHSMGGGVTLKAITVDTRIRAAVLYAPVSGDDAQVLARWGSGCKPGPSGEVAGDCAGAEILTTDMDQVAYLAYAAAVADPAFLYQTSPIHYLDRVIAPVQVHIGTADTRTPPEWAADIYGALQEAAKPVEYYTYPGQGHAFQGQNWRLFIERVTEFFDRYL
jgi:dienelactone hydrolase